MQGCIMNSILIYSDSRRDNMQNTEENNYFFRKVLFVVVLETYILASAVLYTMDNGVRSQ